MEKVLGTIACKGIAIGKISLINHASDEIKVKKINDVDAEMKRLDEALEKSKAELQNLYEKAVKEVGEENAEIFSVHQMMLEDLDYYEAIEKLIREDKYNAEYSVTVTGKSFSETFANMDDDYMKERAADVKDISKRLVSVLMGKNQENIDSNEPVIIVADDLAPSETLQLDKNKILVTEQDVTQQQLIDKLLLCANQEEVEEYPIEINRKDTTGGVRDFVKTYRKTRKPFSRKLDK